MSDWTIGASLTASEAEGVAPSAEWSRWVDRDRAPKSGDGSGFRQTWRDDLAQLGKLGVGELATTLEWARLWPTPDNPDKEEVEFRRHVLAEVSSLGMKPWVYLVDGSLPGWFAEDEGGFTDDHARNLIWPRHIDWIGETFGDLVAGWVPQREPIQWAMWGHLLAAAPPGKQRRRDALRATRSALEADLVAWNLLKGSAPVAVHHTARTFHAEPDNVKAGPHSSWVDDTFHSQWLDWISEGKARDSFDRTILQIRGPISVDGEGGWSPHSSERTVETAMDSLLRTLDNTGDRAVFVAGDLADVADDGTAQQHHLSSMIDAARSAGTAGWWQTSPIDGWHWLGGFDVRPGVIDRDRGERATADLLRKASST